MSCSGVANGSSGLQVMFAGILRYMQMIEYRKMSEGLVRLEFFASEMTRQKYHAEISEIMSTAWMLKVLEVLKANIYSFRKYGPQFVSILSLAYMNSFNYTVAL